MNWLIWGMLASLIQTHAQTQTYTPRTHVSPHAHIHLLTSSWICLRRGLAKLPKLATCLRSSCFSLPANQDCSHTLLFPPVSWMSLSLRNVFPELICILKEKEAEGTWTRCLMCWTDGKMAQFCSLSCPCLPASRFTASSWGGRICFPISWTWTDLGT